MPVVAADGVALVDVIVFVALFGFVIILWSLRQVRTPLGQVPVVGSVGVTLVDGLRRQVVQLATSLLTFLGAQQAAVSDLWVRFITQVVNPYFAWLQAAVISHGLTLEALAQRIVPAIQLAQAQLTALVVHQVVPELKLVGQAEADLDHFTRAVLAAEVTATAGALAVANGEIAQLRAQLGDAAAELASVSSTLAALVAVLPILQQLAAFEAGTSGGVAVLQRDFAQQAGRVTGMEADLQKLLALLGVTALGAVAISTLIRILKDPCGICPGLDLSTVEMRLTALEVFGET